MADKTYHGQPCIHQSPKAQPGGLSLVTIGNSLRGDDGIAQAVCDNLPVGTLKSVCRFDVGSFTYFLIDALRGHLTNIVVDATSSGLAPGTITQLDLDQVIRSKSPFQLSFSHGLSLVEELKIASWKGLVSKSILFVGIEVANTEWQERLSTQLQGKLPEITKMVDELIQKQLENLTVNA
jgi:hydrogenase maturation protease